MRARIRFVSLAVTGPVFAHMQGSQWRDAHARGDADDGPALRVVSPAFIASVTPTSSTSRGTPARQRCAHAVVRIAPRIVRLSACVIAGWVGISGVGLCVAAAATFGLCIVKWSALRNLCGSHPCCLSCPLLSQAERATPIPHPRINTSRDRRRAGGGRGRGRTRVDGRRRRRGGGHRGEAQRAGAAAEPDDGRVRLNNRALAGRRWRRRQDVGTGPDGARRRRRRFICR